MSRTTKMLVIALIVSATLNVFFLGFAAARFARRGRGGHGPAGFDGESGQLGPLAEKLRDRMATLGNRREAIGAARAAVRQALIAEPFSGEVLRGALDALRARTNETQTALDGTLVEFAGTLDVEERRRLAESRFFAGPGAFGPGLGGPGRRGR